MSAATSNVLTLQPASAPPHYRTSPSFTFHAYEHDSPPNVPLNDDIVSSPALSTRRVSRLSAPFPTFLYASEPPPLTARNKQRVRPTAAQLSELKALYAVTPHPAREVREDLGNRIGMRYQSVTNWFQNQRSTAKKRAPIPDQLQKAAPPRSRSRSRSRMSSPSPVRSLPCAIEDNDNMDDSYVSGDDDVQHRRTMEQHHRGYYDDYQPSTLPPRTRTDPVKDIIVAQAAARQQQLNELTLPLSGAAIVPSSFSDQEKNDGPSTDITLNITLPPAPRTTSLTALPSREPTPLLSTFQLSRAPSPSATSTNASVFDTCGEDMHGTEADYGDSTTADLVPRGKRSRPTPHQLAALRALHSVTSSPSIEERTRIGREIGMELGKVTNWFRNLRQTARKKERRALEVEGIKPYIKRVRNREVSRTRQNKRSRIAFDDDDDNSIMSASASMPQPHSGTLETSSGVGSVDMDYDYERPGAYFGPHREEAFVDSRNGYEQPLFAGYNQPFGRQSLDTPPEYLLPRRHDGTHVEGHAETEHEPEHDHESRSELGTESDAAHEAVTPEPQSVSPCAERIPPTPHSMPASSSHSSPNPVDHHSNSNLAKHPSVDDAMLLLAFHGART